MKLEPLGTKVVVKVEEAENKTAKGIIIPDASKEKPTIGVIIAVNETTKSDFNVDVGTKILFGKFSGTEVVLEKEKLVDLKGINIVVTHTCPSYCPPDNTFSFGPFVEGIIRDTGDIGLKTDLNVERQAMTELFHLLKINGNNVENHYYGHFHKSEVQNNDGVVHRMLGVGELWEEK